MSRAMIANMLARPLSFSRIVSASPWPGETLRD